MTSNGARDTIYALSSGHGVAGVAVFRISGPDAGRVLIELGGGLPKARRAVVRTLVDPSSRDALDQALVLWCPAPKSFTGEDVAELHCHGGRAVVAAVLRVLGELPGLRHAEAGEFTRRAFAAGRLDLTEVEGLADLLTAETEVQRKQALRQAGGSLGAIYARWRDEIIWAMAMIEAELDFSEEEDVPGSLADVIWPRLVRLADEVSNHIDQSKVAERIRDGFQVVLLGKPNAGKSSLINALAKRDVAIVTPEAGTTRDLIEVHLDLKGYPVTLIDTAGLRESVGLVEQEGIRRAREKAAQADLILFLQSAEDPVVSGDEFAGLDVPIWLVRSKSDLRPEDHRLGAGLAGVEKELALSMAGDGSVQQLLDSLADHVASHLVVSELPAATRQRHVALLDECRRGLLSAIDMEHAPLELRAEELRSAATALGRITGKVDVEDLLDVIFRDFCIGK